MDKYFIGDIGGTFIKYAVIQEDGTIITKGKEKTPKDCILSFLETLKSIYDTLSSTHEIKGISFSMPGAFDCNTGQIKGWSSIPYLHEASLNFNELFYNTFNMNVFIENDANCGALGELWLGSGKDINNFVYIVYGTGVGGGIIINRQLYKGRTNQGGEFGYMVTNMNWQSENVLGIGEMASTLGLIKNATTKLNLSQDALTGEEIFCMANAGNPSCISAIDDFYNINALLLLNIQFVLDPDKIIVSGPITTQPMFLETIKIKMKQLISKNISFKVDPILESSAIALDANMYGALYNLLSHEGRL